MKGSRSSPYSVIERHSAERLYVATDLGRDECHRPPGVTPARCAAQKCLDLPQGHPDRRAVALALLRTTVSVLEALKATDAGASIQTPARPPAMEPVPKLDNCAHGAAPVRDTRVLGQGGEAARQAARRQCALYGILHRRIGDVPVDQVTKPVLKKFMDLPER